MITTKNKSGKSADKKNSVRSSKNPAERPEKKAPGQKNELVYPHETEASTPREGADATFTERNDVTPPNRKEFPSVGNVKTDFESRPQGRTTGRMIGHEPGTEGI
jgi:hypothetical protein